MIQASLPKSWFAMVTYCSSWYALPNMVYTIWIVLLWLSLLWLTGAVITTKPCCTVSSSTLASGTPIGVKKGIIDGWTSQCFFQKAMSNSVFDWFTFCLGDIEAAVCTINLLVASGNFSILEKKSTLAYLIFSFCVSIFVVPCAVGSVGCLG